MKAALQKSSIPAGKIFVVRELQDKYFDPTWHSHSEYQLFLVTAGTGTRFVGDSIKSFGPGELVFTGPNLPHLWRSDEAYFNRNHQSFTSGIVIYLNEHFLGEELLAKDEFIQLKHLFNRSMRGLEFYGDKKLEVIALMKVLTRSDGIESVIHLLQILTLLAVTKEYEYISPLTYDNPLKKSETDRMNKVYEYIFRNYLKKITLEEVASLLHMTPTSFSRYFSMLNNKTFSRFLAEIRIKHACKLLAETEESVGNICYESGFNTLSNFNNQFREVMNKTPLSYKRDIKSF